MTTATITRIDSGFANVRPTYLIGDHYTGADALELEPVEYQLPEGYTMGQDYAGAPIVLDPDGRHAPITVAYAGRNQEPRPSVDYPRPLATVTEAAK